LNYHIDCDIKKSYSLAIYPDCSFPGNQLQAENEKIIPRAKRDIFKNQKILESK